MRERTAQMWTEKSRAFTLIELALVIAVIGILAAIYLIKTNSAIAQAERTVLLDFVRGMHTAQSAAAAETSAFPTDFNIFIKEAPFDGTETTQTITLSTLADGSCRIADAVTIDCPASAFPSLSQEIGGPVQLFLDPATGLVSTNF